MTNQSSTSTGPDDDHVSSGGPGPALRRPIVAIIAASLLSTTAMGALNVVAGKQVFDLTGRELDLGILGLVEFAPGLILMLFTGALADRVDRRLLSTISLFLQAIVVVGMAAYAATRPTSVVPIFMLMAAFGTARALGNAARRSLPADTMPTQWLAWLIVRNSAATQVGQIIGPVAAGVLYSPVPTVPFCAIAGSLALSAIAISLVGNAHQLDVPVLQEGEVAVARPKPSLREAMAGLRFIRTQPVLLAAISLDLFAVLFGGAIALLPALAEKQLHVGATGLGILRGGVGAGAALMTLFLSLRPLRRRIGVSLLIAVAVFGLGTVVLGITTNFVIALIAIAALSAADSLSMFIRSTLVPLVTPRAMRGRVLSVEIVFVGASNELGAFESGVAGQLLGPAAAVALGGAITMLIAGIFWKKAPALREVDGFPTMET
ncbi:MAG: transporter [Ilumatobacteraceae bacterium]|nr:transporter [Ilumatobacteraceae bacterium]